MRGLVVFIFSYLIGSVSGSFLIGKYHFKMDIRTKGSGNAGTTNAIRVMGLKYGFYTFLIDFFKGLITILVTKNIFGKDYLYLSLLACVLGHMFPFYMHFKGGKGVATTMGASALIGTYPTFLGVIIWIIGASFYRVISLWSITFYCLLPILYYFFQKPRPNTWDFFFLLITCLLGIYRHRGNIKRILRGEEKKLGG